MYMPHASRFEDMVTRCIAAEQIMVRSTALLRAEQILINYI